MDKNAPFHHANIALPGALIEAVQRRVDKGIYSSLDDFLAEAVRERLRVIAGSYHTVVLDTLRKEEDESVEVDSAPGEAQN